MPARRKRGRDVDGVLLLDKPVGWSSNAALQRVRGLLDARKAGHTGSLDPLASGLLPMCLGEATKISSWLLNADKRYRVTADLTCETDTGDREGRPTRYSEVPPPERSRVADVARAFIGEQQQVPPMYSALKHDGRPLYELAREGVEVAREPRAIRVDAIGIRDCAGSQLILDVSVSKGTYVRTLVEDMARAWGGAAHVAALRRSGVGTYDDSAMYDLAHLESLAETGTAALDQVLVPVSRALADWPAVTLSAEAASAVGHGRAVAVPESPAAAGWARIMDASGGFLGLGEVDREGMLAPRRMFTRALR